MLRTLILIPTEFEAEWLRPALHNVLATRSVAAKLCGFGPIASGIRTAQLLAEFRPSSCLLLGIAGAYRSSLEIGSAHQFHEIACYGIGAGSGSEFKSASELGWRQWPELRDDSMNGDSLRIADSTPESHRRQLLTVCAASSSAQDVDQRLAAYPNALAEDMESYSVALACHSSKVPLTIIRGISNRAGDRDKSRWVVKLALDASAQLATEFLGAEGRDVS